MQFCSANIYLNGDARHVVVRGAFDPVSCPEIDVIRFLHGDDAVRDVEVVGEHPQSPRAEKERLIMIYGAQAVEAVYAGRNPNMQMEMPDVRIHSGPWRNPIEMDPAAYGAVDPTAKPEPETPKPAKPRGAALKENPFT